MATECAVCYITDINYLLPSLVSAAGVRKFVPAHKADIYVFLVDEEARIADLNRFLEPYGIQIVNMDSQVYSGFDVAKFCKTHVPPASLGRLFMQDLLPASCQRMVYIDGDTWIKRDPTPLIEAIVPEGKFAAANDFNYFRRNERSIKGRGIRAYLEKLGLNAKTDYFNAGVFATSIKTWNVIARDSYRYFLENTASCVNQDQSALNAVIRGRHLRLSLKWNFQTRFRYLGIEKRVQPHTYHFTEPAKPWLETCGIWKDMQPAYQEAMTAFSTLDLPIRKIDSSLLSANVQMSWKKSLLQKSPFLSGLASLYFGIGAYEREAWL